ncbi:MAG: hypothetical protein Q7R79_03515 [bacterium]|nr:hypothetical protein [bacterium]
MNTKIVIALVAFFVVMVTGAFLFRGAGEGVVQLSVLQEDETELAVFEKDLEIISEDEHALEEVDQTFNDILEGGFGVTLENALDDASLSQEAYDVDFWQTLDDFEHDDAALQDDNEVYAEITQ